MKRFTYISKAVLLYGTVLYFFIYILSAESLTELNPLMAFIGLFILLVLIAVCKRVFKDDNLEDYLPKWFKH